jgi:hypothetical protein
MMAEQAYIIDVSLENVRKPISVDKMMTLRDVRYLASLQLEKDFNDIVILDGGKPLNAEAYDLSLGQVDSNIKVIPFGMNMDSPSSFFA